MTAHKLRVVAALLGATVMAWASSGRAQSVLSVCLEKGGTAMSAAGGNGGDSFDLAVSQALARRLGRQLAVQWYESGMDSDADPAQQVNALLSDGRCRLVAGYPLFAHVLDASQAQRSRLPDFDGATQADRRRWVQLGALIASRGYRYDPLAVVLGPGARQDVRSLADLGGMRIVAEERTLADAILMSYGGGALIGRVTHVVPGADLFGSLERGEQDATLVELHRFDEFRRRHPATSVSSSGHYHSIGFNIGMIGLARDAGLMVEVNDAIGAMLSEGELPALARAAGLTWLTPREPNVASAPSPASLLRD